MKKKNKKALHKIFYGKGYKNLYKGISGFFFKDAHRKLEIDIPENHSYKILEIGPGMFPHHSYISDTKIDKYYFFEKNKASVKFLKKKYKNNNKINIIDNLENYNFLFDRIILSHVLEHIHDPEAFLNKVYKKLKKNGYMSITLPCDPGLLWDIGREFTFYNYWKKNKILKEEYYFHMSLEHVNSVRNLRRILQYKYNVIKETFLPFKIKIFGLNLFYNVTIQK
tara:strand:+ start:88 stop:759 length:672 start_codon:yes stop_codon:yes gene_type:complete